MRVLVINHTATVGGAEVALLEQVSRDILLPDVDITIACPDGQLAEVARERGVHVVPIRDFEFSLKFQPRYIFRQLINLLMCAVEIRRLAVHSGADIIHANSLRAGLMAGAARCLGGARVVTHIHDCLPMSGPTRVIRRVLLATSTGFIANSHYTSTHFLTGISTKRPMRVVYNTFAAAWGDSDVMSKVGDLRATLGLEETDLTVGIVAQLSPWKGQDLAIRAFARASKGAPNLKLIIVGSAKFQKPGTRFDNLAYEETLHDLVDILDLTDKVIFVGEIGNVEVMDMMLDLLIMPSWEEPFGRAAVEMMAVGSTVVSTNVGGPPEFIEHEVTGLLLDPHDDATWADAITRLFEDERWRSQMGIRARLTVKERFFGNGPETQVIPVFRELLS